MSCSTLIQGRRIRLRPLTEADLPQLSLWDRDPVVAKFWGKKFEPGQSPQRWLTDLNSNSRRVGLAIETRDGHLIGDLQFEDINRQSQSAELRISIGSAHSRGRGYGTEAVSLATRFAFEDLQLQEIYVRVALANWPAIRCYHKCGFVAEGIMTTHGRNPQGQATALMVLAGP